jgi:hypothetical protein
VWVKDQHDDDDDDDDDDWDSSVKSSDWLWLVRSGFDS